MTGRRSRLPQADAEQIMSPTEASASTIPASSVVMGVVARVAGIVPVRQS